MPLLIQEYSDNYASEIADVFYRAVHSIDSDIYTLEQQEAWALTPPDYKAWEDRLRQKAPWLGFIDDQLVGFIELDMDGYIDCLYVHPNYQKRGVASALYAHVLLQATAMPIARLYVNASYPAKPFFESRGFTLVSENNVQRQGVTLVNFTMEMHLDTSIQAV